MWREGSFKGSEIEGFLKQKLQIFYVNFVFQRSQEWNISRKELLEIVDLGIISEEEMEDCISVEFNPVNFPF